MLRIAEEPVSLWGASNINDMKKRARALLVSQPLNEIDERNAFWDFNRTIAYLLRGEQLNGNILPQVIAINANTFDTSVKLWKGPSVVTPRTYLNYHILRAAEAAVTSRPFYILISGNDENCHKLLSCIENNPELATLRNRVFILSDLRPNQKITLTSAAEFETKMAVEIEYIGKVYYFINNEWQLIRRDLRNTLALTTSIAQRVGLSQNRIALLKDATIKHELCDREPVLRKKLFLLKEDGTPNYDHRDFDFIDERYIEKRWRGISQDELLLIQYRNCYTRFIEDRRANRIKAGSLSLDDIQLMLEVAKVSDDFETANDATKKRARGKYDRTTGRINPEPFGAAISWITGKYPELVGNPALKALIDLIGEEDPIIMNAIIDLRSPRDLVADAIYYQGGLDKDDRLFIETHRISTVTLVENSIRWRRYLTKNADLFANIFGEDKTTTLIRVPVEAIESVGIDNIKNFLTTFQTAPNGYVELYYISSTGEVTESVYQKYGLAKKALPKDFKRTRENTVTLFSALKGEELDQSAILSRLGSLDISPQDSILSPIGLQHDPAGLIRATILGLKIMDLARQIKEGHGAYLIEGHVDRDKVQSEILEQVKNVCDQEALKNINLTPDDIIALAIGNINNIISALKKLIKLLPITPINAEELRQIYEHAKAVITAA
jgi:hypothetical protein